MGAALELLDAQRPDQTDNIDLRGWDWYFLKRSCHSEALRLEPQAKVTAMALAPAPAAPDGVPLIASGGEDGSVLLWDGGSGRRLHVLRGHAATITGLSFSGDGRRLASASGDSTARVWDTATGEELLVYDQHVMGISGISFRPGSFELCTTGDDYTLRFWSSSHGADRLVVQLHNTPRLKISDFSFSPDGNRLACAAEDSGMAILDAQTGKILVQAPSRLRRFPSVRTGRSWPFRAGLATCKFSMPKAASR